MRKSITTRRIFCFNSGARIEVFWHLGLNKWAVTWEQPTRLEGDWNYYAGFHKTKKGAFKEARAEVAKRTTAKLLTPEKLKEISDAQKRRMGLAIHMKRGKGVQLLTNLYGDLIGPTQEKI